MRDVVRDCGRREAKRPNVTTRVGQGLNAGAEASAVAHTTVKSREVSHRVQDATRGNSAEDKLY